jgi:dCTP deaminase
MSKLVDWEIHELLESTNCVSPVDFANIQSNSLDVFLDKTFLIESERGFDPVDLNNSFLMCPNAFGLGNTIEFFDIPHDISAEFRLNSGGARKGLAHSIAIDLASGFKGVLTLELKNYSQFHPIELSYGMKIGQIIFHRHSTVINPYNGKYNGDRSVRGAKD